jgi:transposase-like protein
LDEVFIRIRGVLHYLWRAVDQHGVVLDILVQDRRDGTAAKRFFKRLLTGLQYKPKRLITDGLRSYGVARRARLPDVKHRTGRYLNNRAENSHRPTRRRERQMQRFKSAGHRRLRSIPVIISIQQPAPDLNGALTSVAKITDSRPHRQGAVTGRIPRSGATST